MSKTATQSVVLGSLSVLLFLMVTMQSFYFGAGGLIPILNLILAVGAIVTGGKSLRSATSKSDKTTSIIGMVLGILTALVLIAAIFFSV